MSLNPLSLFHVHTDCDLSTVEFDSSCEEEEVNDAVEMLMNDGEWRVNDG